MHKLRKLILRIISHKRLIQLIDFSTILHFTFLSGIKKGTDS